MTLSRNVRTGSVSTHRARSRKRDTNRFVRGINANGTELGFKYENPLEELSGPMSAI